MDTVSVVIPVYNAEDHLEETLLSVLKQTYPDIEIIVVDDGSQDRSIEIVEKFEDRVVLIKQKNSGAAAARNRGIQEATGKWIAFVDADDIWYPEKIQRQLDSCGSFAWSYTDFIFNGGVNHNKKFSDVTPKYQGMILDKLICQNFIGTSTVMVRRDCFAEKGGFDETLRSIQDWELWVRLASAYEICYLHEPLVNYRVHATSITRSTRKTLPNHLKAIEKVFAKGGPAENLQHLKSPAQAMSYGICSQIAEEEGDMSFAFNCALKAWVQEPTNTHRVIRVAKTAVKYFLSFLGLTK